MKLSQWAKEQGINYMTAYRWFKKGTLPKHLEAYQAPTGTILIKEQDNTVEEDESELIKDLLSVIRKHKKTKKEK